MPAEVSQKSIKTANARSRFQTNSPLLLGARVVAVQAVVDPVRDLHKSCFCAKVRTIRILILTWLPQAEQPADNHLLDKLGNSRS